MCWMLKWPITNGTTSAHAISRKFSTLGDEILDFYQPDEDLKLEDIVSDIEVPTPEQSVEAKELQKLVRSLLAQMPREWRRALLLHYVGWRPEAEVAKAPQQAGHGGPTHP
jgi:DNA-directed RNA polymerase specialized sigma24 family protein